MRWRSLALAAFVTLASCAREPQPLALEGPDVEAIQQAETALNAAIASDDVEATLALYHHNAALITQSGEWLVPLDIRDAYRELSQDPNGGFELETPSLIEVARNGGLAYSIGSYIERRTGEGDGRIRGERGTSMRVWAEEDGSWRILRETRTSRSSWTD